MNAMRVPAALAMLFLVAFAGCTGSNENNASNGFKYDVPEDPVNEPVVVTALVSADSYEWNMGDGVTFLTGESVSHVYGIQNGNVTVRLKAYTGEDMQEFARTITIGNGINRAPAFALEFSEEWTTVNDGLILSMKNAVDPDGDPISFQWTCTYEGPVALKGGSHGHAGGGGGFQPAPRAYEAVLLETEVPAPETQLPNDLCMPDQIGRSDVHTETVALLPFTVAGQYHLHLWAKDPVNPSVSTDFVFLVTDSKPAPEFRNVFDGNLTLGTGGTAQGTGSQVGDVELDQRSHRVSLPTAATNVTVNMAHTGTAPVDDVAYTIFRGGTSVRTDLGTGTTDIGNLARGEYDIVITYNQGAQVGYVIDFQAELDLDPRATYEFHG